MASGGGRGVFRGKWEFVSGDMFRGGANSGWYNTFQHEVAEANRSIAVKLQKAVAQALRQGLVRPNVSSGALERVTRDSRNVIANKDGFGVGVFRFLDQSEAKYWEQIEIGSDVHLDQRLTGVWATRTRTETYSGLAGEQFTGRVARGAVSPFRAGKGQAFMPMGARQARDLLRKQGLRGKEVRIAGIIRKPIPAEKYYSRAWREFNVLRVVEREYNAIFNRIGIKVRWVGTGDDMMLIKTDIGGKAAAQRRADRGTRL